MHRRILFDKAGGEGGGSGGSAGENKGAAGAAGGQSGSGTGGSNNGGTGGTPNGDPSGGKSGNSSDPLFGNDGGGAAGNGSAGSGNPSAGAGDPNKKSGEGTQPFVFPDNWKDSLPQELKDDATIKNIPDVQTMAKTLVNAQKMIGADKVVIPGKHASDADWKEAMHKLGNPRSLEEYTFEIEKDVEAGVDKEFMGKFKEQAWKLGVLPKQAKSMIEWFSGLNKQVWEEASKAQETSINESLKGLEKEWGNAYKENLIRAKAAIDEFADEGLKKAFKEMDLGRNPAFLKFVSKVGSTLAEDKIRGHGGGVGEGVYSPSEALAKIEMINKNIKHPYWDKNHEKHMEAKKEMASLYEMAHPKEKTS